MPFRPIAKKRFLWPIVFTLALSSCWSQRGPEIPPVEQFKTPALGTPVPLGGESQPFNLPQGSSGALLINQTGSTVQVVVSDTIASIPASQSFLFLLPPGAHEFYVYKTTANPWSHTEHTQAGKVRYVYLLPPKLPQ